MKAKNTKKISSVFSGMLALTLLFSGVVYAESPEQFSILLFTKTAGYHHKSTPSAIQGIKRLADQHHFELAWHQDSRKFNNQYLSKFDAVVFLNTSGDILNDKQQTALREYIESGKGFVAIHGAIATEEDWPWFGKLIGRRMLIHPPLQTAQVSVLQSSFPGMALFPENFWWTDEWYELKEEENTGIRYLLSVDEKTFNPVVQWQNLKGEGMGEFHPVSWCHRVGDAHVFSTTLGHNAAAYRSDMFLSHLYGGIYWAAKAGELPFLDKLCSK